MSAEGRCQHLMRHWILFILYTALIISIGLLARLVYVTTTGRPKVIRRKDGKTCSLAVFLGSGGHTSEMMQLIKALPQDRYTSRTYIMTTNDRFSLDKALEYEKSISTSNQVTSHSSQFSLIYLPRARNVHQRWLSTPLSVLFAFAKCVHRFVIQESYLGQCAQADVIIMNGPGTCVPIVASIYLLRMLGRRSPRMIYVESFARVSTLSLTAKILSRFVDRFVVQWPAAAVKGADYRGILV